MNQRLLITPDVVGQDMSCDSEHEIPPRVEQSLKPEGAAPHTAPHDTPINACVGPRPPGYPDLLTPLFTMPRDIVARLGSFPYLVLVVLFRHLSARYAEILLKSANPMIHDVATRRLWTSVIIQFVTTFDSSGYEFRIDPLRFDALVFLNKPPSAPIHSLYLHVICDYKHRLPNLPAWFLYLSTHAPHARVYLDTNDVMGVDAKYPKVLQSPVISLLLVDYMGIQRVRRHYWKRCRHIKSMNLRWMIWGNAPFCSAAFPPCLEQLCIGICFLNLHDRNNAGTGFSSIDLSYLSCLRKFRLRGGAFNATRHTGNGAIPFDRIVLPGSVKKLMIEGCNIAAIGSLVFPSMLEELWLTGNCGSALWNARLPQSLRLWYIFGFARPPPPGFVFPSSLTVMGVSIFHGPQDLTWIPQTVTRIYFACPQHLIRHQMPGILANLPSHVVAQMVGSTDRRFRSFSETPSMCFEVLEN